MKKIFLNEHDSIPALGLGTWKSAEGDVNKAVKKAIEIGYRHIDCAAIYGNEAEIGQALEDVISAGIVTRKELWITSKLWNNSHRKDQVRPALEKTLRDLRLDYLDLYLIHWPVALQAGVAFPVNSDDFLSLKDAPVTETWEALESCVDRGQTHYIGLSNFSISKIQSLLPKARIRPIMNQVEMHPYLQQNDLLNYCHGQGIQVTAYSPLGSGDRPERLKKEDDPVLADHPVIVDIAEKYSCTWAQVLLAWAMNRGTIVIPKSVNPARLQQNLEANSIDLDADDMARISEMDLHFRFINGATWVSTDKGYTLASLWDE